MTLGVFHFEISFGDDIYLQFSKTLFIMVTLEVFYFKLSGKDDNDEQ